MITVLRNRIARIDGETRSHKSIHRAVVPTLMLGHPVVGDVWSACGIDYYGDSRDEMAAICPQGNHCVRWVRLLKCRTPIGESSDAPIASEIVIERAIFLD